MSTYWTTEEDGILLRLIQERKLYREIAEELQEAGYSRSAEGVRKHYKQLESEGLTPALTLDDVVEVSEVQDNLSNRIMTATRRASMSYEELSDKFDTGISKIRAAVKELSDCGYNITVTDNEQVAMSPQPELGGEYKIDIYNQTKGVYRFGAIGDSHMCSKYERLDVLEALYDEFKRQELDTVYHCGNWIDGEFRFNKHDLHTAGLDAQLQYFVEAFPQRKGIKTYYISGDCHEGWYGQREGLNIGQHLMYVAKEYGRDDLEHIGHLEADVVYKAPEGQTTVRLVHPGGGSAYALSYSVQKIVESYQGGEKPQVLLCGHYHKAEYSYIRGVHCVQVGCFSQNTKVTMADGSTKSIKDVQVGNEVLTHQGRPRTVKRLYTRMHDEDMVAMNYGRKGRLDQTLTATPEHPILVERDGATKWLEIKDVVPGDLVFVESTNCEVTGELIPFWMKMGENANPMDVKEVRDKLSKTKGGKDRQRGNSCGEVHLHRDILPYCKELNEQGWQAVPVGAGTIPDIVGFKDGKVVVFEIENSTGRLREFRQTKYDDAPINEYIDDVIWVPLKQRAKQPRAYYEANPETGFCKVKVLNVSRHKPKRRIRVYNFEVDGDNSYVAGHVAVHNCTQDQTPFMRKKKLQAHLGGWICELGVGEQGSVTWFKQQFFPFYDREYHYKWAYQW